MSNWVWITPILSSHPSNPNHTTVPRRRPAGVRPVLEVAVEVADPAHPTGAVATNTKNTK